MDGNTWIYFVAALVPMVIGFIWYNPKTLGNIWMKAAKVTQEDIEGGNMPLIFGLSYAFSLLLALILNYFVHHEFQIMGTLFDDPKIAVARDSELGLAITPFIETIKSTYRTFGHGAAHGLILSVGLILPVFATNAMFERKGFKYVMVNWGYWTVTIMVMGGLLSQFF